MKSLKALALIVSVGFALTGTQSQAAHVGGFLGTSIFGGSGYNSTNYLTGGLDATFGFTPALELGGFWQKTSSGVQSVFGAELNVFPMVTHCLQVGAKVGSASLGNGNYFTYGPSLGLNHDIAPSISLGAEATYFMYTNFSNFHDLALLGNLKIWL